MKTMYNLLYKDTDNYVTSFNLLLPTLVLNNKVDMEFLKGYRSTKICFNTIFSLTNTDNSINMEIALLGFGIGFYLRTKEFSDD